MNERLENTASCSGLLMHQDCTPILAANSEPNLNFRVVEGPTKTIIPILENKVYRFVGRSVLGPPSSGTDSSTIPSTSDQRTHDKLLQCHRIIQVSDPIASVTLKGRG
ncbi:hypothetical protein KIN20_038308 [Parelaphostrongylus tenuis]|uniref:Uncharacterized protein n=1 Tax=Parelaphostrongylus tenuis TaxID=148309 RepID=A0AAD5RFE7_PARTN|nr:hypothetical protein KIN20_038308 [Parelaphostrongylus tenuis]